MYMHKNIVDWYHPAFIFYKNVKRTNSSSGTNLINYLFTPKEVYYYYYEPIVTKERFKENNYKPFDSTIDIRYEKVDDNYINGVNLTDVAGISITSNQLNNVYTLIDMATYYLILSNHYIYNDNIYKKIEGAKISYKYVGSIKEVLYDNFMENVTKFYMLNFEYYFINLDVYYIFKNQLIKMEPLIAKIKHLTTNKINPDFSLIEFNDGVYSIKYDRFFSNNNSDYTFIDSVSTIKYYNKSYERVRRSKPEAWVKNMLISLNIKTKDYENNTNFKMICLYICNILHKDLLNKKKTLHI